MSNQPSSRNYLQAEAVDFRSPVSESMLKTFAGTANWLLDKDTTNDTVTFPNIASTISTLTGRVNNSVSFATSSKTQVGFTVGGTNTIPITTNSHEIKIIQATFNPFFPTPADSPQMGTVLVSSVSGTWLGWAQSGSLFFLFPSSSIVFTNATSTYMEYVTITFNNV